MGLWTRFLGRSSEVERGAVNSVVEGSIPSVPAIAHRSSSGSDLGLSSRRREFDSPTVLQLSRRSFLVGAAATAVAAPPIARTFFGPPRGGWPVADFNTDVMRYKAYERYSVGWTEPQAIYGTSYGCGSCKPMSAAEFRKAVEPGLNQIFSEVYESRCDEWEKLCGDDGVSLKSALHPGSKPLTEEDQVFIEEGGWKCINGHPYCNRCASPVELSEASLEKMLIDIKERVDPRKLRLDPTKTWYLSPEVSDGLKRFERQAPILIKSGRRWFRD